MARTEYDSLFLRFPKSHGWGAALEAIAARQRAAGKADLASKTAIGQMIVGVFLKTIAEGRDQTREQTARNMARNMAGLYHQLYREDGNNATSL